MKKRVYNQTSLFGPLYAYLVVISPPEWVRKEIAFLKKELNSITEIGERNLHSIGHITLIDNLTDDPELKDSVAKMVQFTEPFLIRLQNVNTFNHGKYSTLFIDVENPNPIINVLKSLKSPYKTPHLSIAKRVPNDQAEKLKNYLQHIDYEAEWLCDEITVLRKLMSEKHLGFKESFKISLSKKI